MVLAFAGRARGRHDADDAFQATFLVLVKKARALGEGFARVPGSIRSPFAPPVSAGSGRTGGAHEAVSGHQRRGEPDGGADDDLGPGCTRRSSGCPSVSGCPGPLRSRAAHPRAGGPASGLADRNRQEPAGTGEAATRTPFPPRPGTGPGLSRRLEPMAQISLRLPPLIDSTAPAIGFASTGAIAAGSTPRCPRHR